MWLPPYIIIHWFGTISFYQSTQTEQPVIAYNTKTEQPVTVYHTQQTKQPKRNVQKCWNWGRRQENVDYVESCTSLLVKLNVNSVYTINKAKYIHKDTVLYKECMKVNMLQQEDDDEW